MSVRNIDYDSVRYLQEYLYPYFANGKISVGELYIALANGLIDPASLAPITIFEYNEQLYCIDTRRLTITKELQRKTKNFDVLKRFPFQYVTKGDVEFVDQYFNFQYERLPAMKKKGLDGSTIKLYRELDYMCCYNSVSGNFRDDLHEHIAQDHCKMSFSEFKGLNISQCNRCNKKVHIYVIKPSNKSNYIFKQNCACRNSKSLVLHTIKKPWIEVTLREICDIFLVLNSSAVKSVDSEELSNEVSLNNNRKIEEIKTNGFIKQFCLFLFIAILSWLIYLYFQIK